MQTIDLHTHSTFSDGSCTPTEILQRAHEKGLAALAVTDHDNVGGVAEAMNAGEALDIEVIPGVEFGSGYRGRSIHLLGYLFDPDEENLRDTIDSVQNARVERNEVIASRMRADGIPVTVEELIRKHGTTSIGRPHFAKVFVEHGKAESVRDAFQKFLNPGRAYYYPRTFIPLAQAAGVLRHAGGVPVLAHPFQYRFTEEERQEWLQYCRSIGIEGLECRYSGYDGEQTAYLDAMAEKYGFCRTGGSDFHGTFKPDIDIGTGKGSLAVPLSFLEELKQRREEILHR